MGEIKDGEISGIPPIDAKHGLSNAEHIFIVVPVREGTYRVREASLALLNPPHEIRFENHARYKGYGQYSVDHSLPL